MIFQLENDRTSTILSTLNLYRVFIFNIIANICKIKL